MNDSTINLKSCPRCEAPLQKGQTVCARCGLLLDALAPPLAAPPEPALYTVPLPRARVQGLPVVMALVAVLALSVAVVMAQRGTGTTNGTVGAIATGTPFPTVQPSVTDVASTRGTIPPVAAIPTLQEPIATLIPTSQATDTATAVRTATGTYTATTTTAPTASSTSAPTNTPSPTYTAAPTSTVTHTPAPTNTPLLPTFTRIPAKAPTVYRPIKQATATQKPAPPTATRTVPPTPKPLPTPQPQPTQTPPLIIGSTASGVNGWTLKLVGVDTREQLPGGAPNVIYRPRGIFWLVRIDAANSAGQPRSLGKTTDFVLQDGLGSLYSELSNHGTQPDMRGVVVGQGFSYMSDLLPPGGSTSTLLIFDLPRGAQPKQLVARTIVGGNSVSTVGQISWGLGNK